MDPPRKTAGLFLSNGYGIGIYSPKADTPWNVGATDESISKESTSPDTMHIAPLTSAALTHDAVFTYRYWLIVGHQDAISSRLEELIRLYPEG